MLPQIVVEGVELLLKDEHLGGGDGGSYPTWPQRGGKEEVGQGMLEY